MSTSTQAIEDHPVVSPAAWRTARVALLEKEKEQLTRLRDEFAAARRQLPWVAVEKPYGFDTTAGKRTLAELFDDRTQLVIYHFMFAPEWEVGCKSCSFWADNFERSVIHLAHRDVKLMAVSRAPLAKLTAFRARMGWTFEWASSGESDFNYDLGVSFTPEQVASGRVPYNFTEQKTGSEMPGISVFYKRGDRVMRTYSSYGRGIEPMNATYQYLDLIPKGRDEQTVGNMGWLRLRDAYGG